ncbi:hypothetical protein AB0H12_03810 [Actinosynnema sp. NPDC023794]
MAHLLMIESWVGAMGSSLPRAIHESGHRFTFLTRDLRHYPRSAPAHPHPLPAADNVLTAGTNDVPSPLSYVERAHGVPAFDGVISSCDYYLSTVATVAAHLGLPGADPKAVERAYRKDLTRATSPTRSSTRCTGSVRSRWSTRSPVSTRWNSRSRPVAGTSRRGCASGARCR